MYALQIPRQQQETLAASRAAALEAYRARRPELTEAQKRELKAQRAEARTAREAQILRRAGIRSDLAKMKSAFPSSYKVASSLPEGLQEELRVKAERSARNAYTRKGMTDEEKKAAKETKLMKKATLRAYDATHGTKLTRPAPATLKIVDGIPMSWNDLVREVFNQEGMSGQPIQYKINEAARIWRGAGEPLVRPDIVKKYELKQERIRKAQAKGKDLPARWAELGAEASAKAARRRAVKEKIFAENPDEWAQQVAQEKFYKKLQQEQKQARKIAPAVARSYGIRLEPQPEVREFEGFAGDRAAFSRYFGKGDAKDKWERAAKYDLGIRPVERARVLRSMVTARGTQSLRGKGVYLSREPTEETYEDYPPAQEPYIAAYGGIPYGTREAFEQYMDVPREEAEVLMGRAPSAPSRTPRRRVAMLSTAR